MLAGARTLEEAEAGDVGAVCQIACEVARVDVRQELKLDRRGEVDAAPRPHERHPDGAKNSSANSTGLSSTADAAME